MKKNYIQPTMLTVKLQQMEMLCQSINNVVSGEDDENNTGIGYGGGSGGEGRVKESHNIWDNEW